ncbi:hypothetical protein K3495_g1219 [Podosphaera aphanis]|nr:hypothetical protein K3495_g1219 [Podosphaera aphanis]
MNIEITHRASSRLKEIMAEDSNPNLAIRIQVENGGCHGFQYTMSLTTLPSLETCKIDLENNDQKSEQDISSDSNAESPQVSMSTTKDNQNLPSLGEDDTVFTTDDGSGAKVVMDVSSLEVLRGSKVDYTMELIGSQFKIIDNPLATSSCGCGTSFDIK